MNVTYAKPLSIQKYAVKIFLKYIFKNSTIYKNMFAYYKKMAGRYAPCPQ